MPLLRWQAGIAYQRRFMESATDFPDHKECPDIEAPAALSVRADSQNLCIWEKLKEVGIRIHHIWIVLILLPDRYSLQNIVLSLRIINTIISILDISGFPLPIHRHMTGILGVLKLKLEYCSILHLESKFLLNIV